VTIAALAVLATARSDRGPLAFGWNTLPMPAIGPGVIESTAIVGVGRQAVLAVGMRRGSSEHVRYWRRAGQRWRSVALERPVVRDLSEPLALAEFRGQACVVVKRQQRIRLACVEPDTGVVTLSPAVPPAGVVTGVNALSAISGSLYLTISGPRNSSPTRSSMPTAVHHPQVLVFRFDGTSWTRATLAGDQDAAGGQLAQIAGRPCVLLTGGPPGDDSIEKAGVHCGGDKATTPWPVVGRPVGRDRTTGIFAGHSLASLGGDPLVGLLDYAPSGGKPNGAWRVLRLRDGRWRPSPLTVKGDRYAAQGHLYTFGDEAWSFLFEQRPVGGAMNLIARLRVQRAGPSDQTATNVGPPLVDREELYGPIDYGLAEIDNRIYAAYMKPNPREQRNLPRVAVLTQTTAPRR
jgi:hypothetical protein